MIHYVDLRSLYHSANQIKLINPENTMVYTVL